MTSRVALRPLVRVLRARAKGQDPDLIEQENRYARHLEAQNVARAQAEGRLLLLSLLFVLCFGLVGVQMVKVAVSDVSEPKVLSTSAPILAQRADIVDRHGRLLATNRTTHSLYAQPQEMIDPYAAASGLVDIFPDLDYDRLIKDFTGERKFLWVKRKIAPEQQQAVHDLGEPGLLFGPREERLYPNGRLAAHILGGTRFGREGVLSAELVGQAGIERYFDDYLSDPANGETPLELSIDLSVQTTLQEVLAGGMAMLSAQGAAAVMMDIHTGEVISLVSLPDFDPNARPRPFAGEDAGLNPRFNRAVQGMYELGSTFKIFTAAQAVQMGIATPQTQIPAQSPFKWGKYKIGEFDGKNFGPSLSLTDMIVKSSNVATAHLARDIGINAQQEFLGALGFFEPSPIELIEAKNAKPLLPRNWSELSTLTIAYGHGLSASPLHLATGYASLLNGGTKVSPTLLKQNVLDQGEGDRIVSQEVSRAAREMLRAVVTSDEGTASFADVSGYRVGGKTGTADKPLSDAAGYYEDKTITTFASVFPADDPEYILIVTLDEAVDTAGEKPRRSAGWTAVPVAGEMIRRTAPLLGLRPEF